MEKERTNTGWDFRLGFQVGNSGWELHHILRCNGKRENQHRLGFQVGISGWDFRLGFQVGISGWDFRLGFQVGNSGWELHHRLRCNGKRENQHRLGFQVGFNLHFCISCNGWVVDWVSTL